MTIDAPPTTPIEATAGPSSLVHGLVRTARPTQWPKSILVFAAILAAGDVTHAHLLPRVLAAFGIFCVTASGVYFINDLIDVEADRLHPTKRNRAIAAGIVSPEAAVAAAAVLISAGLAGAFLLRWQLGAVMLTYVGVQSAYSWRLKHLAVYDLIAVSSGFVLRAIAGAVAVRVSLSEWFLIVTTFGSLLMVTGKRLAEHIELGEERGAHRATLDAYTTTFLRTVLGISAGGAIIGYCLWAFGLEAAQIHHTSHIWFELSVVPIMIGLLRFTLLADGGVGARPEKLLSEDRGLQVVGAVWLALFVVAAYLS